MRDEVLVVVSYTHTTWQPEKNHQAMVVRVGYAIKGAVLLVVLPLVGLAGAAVPSRAPNKGGGSNQGLSFWKATLRNQA